MNVESLRKSARPNHEDSSAQAVQHKIEGGTNPPQDDFHVENTRKKGKSAVWLCRDDAAFYGHKKVARFFLDFS